jgi:hypothetical protein
MAQKRSLSLLLLLAFTFCITVIQCADQTVDTGSSASNAKKQTKKPSTSSEQEQENDEKVDKEIQEH